MLVYCYHCNVILSISHHVIWYSERYVTDTHTIWQSHNIHTAPSTPPSTIYCHHNHSVVTKLLQSCQCELSGSISHSSGVGVAEPTARSLVGEGHLIALHNLPHWLGPGEGDGCGGLGDCHGDGRGRGRLTWGWKEVRSLGHFKLDGRECMHDFACVEHYVA